MPSTVTGATLPKCSNILSFQFYGALPKDKLQISDLQDQYSDIFLKLILILCPL
jgi:hypothetical protein